MNGRLKIRVARRRDVSRFPLRSQDKLVRVKGALLFDPEICIIYLNYVILNRAVFSNLIILLGTLKRMIR